MSVATCLQQRPHGSSSAQHRSLPLPPSRVSLLQAPPRGCGESPGSASTWLPHHHQKSPSTSLIEASPASRRRPAPRPTSPASRPHHAISQPHPETTAGGAAHHTSTTCPTPSVPTAQIQPPSLRVASQSWQLGAASHLGSRNGSRCRSETASRPRNVAIEAVGKAGFISGRQSCISAFRPAGDSLCSLAPTICRRPGLGRPTGVANGAGRRRRNSR